MTQWPHVCLFLLSNSSKVEQIDLKLDAQLISNIGHFYAGAGGIMFSGCPSVRPSVRPKPEIPSFDMYMGPLVHPTNRNHFTACPSVRLSVRPSGEVSGHLPENAWREWPEILHADVSWPSSELISLWLRSVDFSNFGAILT